MEPLLSQKAYLELLYNDIFRIIGYIHFKLACLRDQENVGIDLDVELCLKTKVELEQFIGDKIRKLIEVMPKNLGKVLRTKPKIRADGWEKYLTEKGLSLDTTEVRDTPNPKSHSQLKSWLISLGWIPITFKFSKSTKKKVAQISLPNGAGLCPSVKRLYSVEPALQELDGFYVAAHRFSIINSYLEMKDENNKVYSTAHGFTNTMRLAHSKPIVNLPSVTRAFGEKIRGCLIVPNSDYIMCGADVNGLEDNTKQHYIYFFDPKYVTEMRVPGFDPHMDIALLAGMVTSEDAFFYAGFKALKAPTQEEKDRYKAIGAVRH